MMINKNNKNNPNKSENHSKNLLRLILTRLLSILMSGYSSDGALSISSTSDSVSTKNRDQSLLSWNDKEKGQSDNAFLYESESDMDIGLRGTRSP